MPTRTITIYEVPNSYVASGGTATISNVLTMVISDDDAILNPTAASDPGAPQTITVGGSPASAYNFIYTDQIRWRRPGGWQNEDVITFQLVIAGVTRSFIMNNEGNSIGAMRAGSQIELQSFTNFTGLPYTNFPCFVAGTLIEAEDGPRAVETLRPGDLVRTLDHGLQPLRWVGKSRLGPRELTARPDMAPICIRAGALGEQLPWRDLMVSPQHRVLLRGWEVELNFAQAEALAPAVALLACPGVSRVQASAVVYVHLMFDRHEIVFSEGLPSESFRFGATIRDGMDEAQRDEIAALFPDLLDDGADGLPAARPILRPVEARSLRRPAA